MQYSTNLEQPSQSGKAGTALFVVLIVLVMLTLAAYTFMSTMVAERQAARMALLEAQARHLAESGIEYAATVLTATTDPLEQNFYHDPGLFAAISVTEGIDQRGAGQFTLVAPVENDFTNLAFRYGLINESGKLNINDISALNLTPEQERELLMWIPNMTESLADAILDWVDADDEPRQFGAESETYSTYEPPYSAKNGRCESLDELLKVAGMTYSLLYGEDANRNGLLDPNENDGDRMVPPDNADGILDLGISAYLTVYSKEANLRSDGSARINLNQALLTELYDVLAEEFDEEIATFVVAYRLNGSVNILPLSELGATTGDAQTDNLLQEMARAVVRGAVSGNTNNDTVTRGGMDLSRGGSYKFDSLYDLIDAVVEVEIDGVPTELTSPWTSDPASLTTTLPEFFDTFTVTAATSLRGRININSARPEILAGIPNMPEDLPWAIANSPLIGANGQALPDELARRSTTAWLLVDGLADQTTMRQLEPFLTARGSVFRVQSLGHFSQGAPVCRLEAIIDSSTNPAKILSLRDLSSLGAGYPLQPAE
jgi:hypothetical protein